ncbi:unnamed protein product [Brassica napus]|uniref:Small ribosomal subunit protein uS3 n=1 Tax=Brassica napus TaxID=3708 RepID=A0A816JPI1_BRANA|nr:unnamed protein product [Brassica napus]
MATQISKKRKFVADGVFYAELNEVLTRELAEDGYSGVEVRVTPMRTEIIIRATRTQNVLGEKGRRIRELTSLVQKRFRFPQDSVELYAEKVANRGLCAIAQAESLRYKLLGGLAVRRACYGVLRFVMESGAKGCEVIVSGKLRAARAKSMKFKDGYMVSSGQPTKEYIDSAVRHVLLRQQGGIQEAWAEIETRGGGGHFAGESRKNKLEKRKSQVLLEGYVEASAADDDRGDLARGKSLTDDDLEELKGCLDLGFGFSYDEIPELCNTLPALELCYSMSQKFLDDQQNQKSPEMCLAEEASPPPPSTTNPVANWKISSPGDNPDDVKARLKYWAQAVACTVRLCS